MGAGSATSGTLCETVQRRRFCGTERSLSGEGIEERIHRPAPRILRGTPLPRFPGEEGFRGVGRRNRGGLRFSAGHCFATKPPSAPLGRDSRCRQKHGEAGSWGVRCPAPHNNKVAGSGRLEAAFDPTGHGNGEGTEVGSVVTRTAVFQQAGLGRFSNLRTL